MNAQQAKSIFRSPNPADYTELEGYSREQIYDETIGGGALYLAARMVRTMRLNRGDIVLDLGCGKGATSMFLARHFGVKVIAVDLWHPAALLNEKFTARGLRQDIVPLHMDITRELPFAENYFDAIFSMNSFSFYGGTVEFLHHLLKHLKPGGQLCVGSEVLSDEFTPEQLAHPPYVYAFKLPPPNENVDVFADDFSKRANRSLLLRRASRKRGRSSQLKHRYRRQQILAALDGNKALPVQIDLSRNPHPVL